MADRPTIHHVDFSTVSVDDLKSIEIPFEHTMNKAGIVHGYALYFDVLFLGSDINNATILSTGPEAPNTHWYQTRLLMREPIGVNKGQTFAGSLKMEANKDQSFDGTLTVEIPAHSVS